MSDTREVRRSLSRNGYIFLEKRFDAEFCAQVRSFVDSVPAASAEINYGGSEKRIWQSHLKCPAVAEFREFADQLLTTLFMKFVESRDVLAISNFPVSETPELNRGRWHMDSLRRQIKVFAFLTDVGERNGPLEIIPGTHRPLFKASHVADGELVHPGDFLGSTRKYQRLDDDWVDQISEKRRPKPMTCPMGSVLVVNTSAIHRARPCFDANRYALTAYYARI